MRDEFAKVAMGVLLKNALDNLGVMNSEVDVFSILSNGGVRELEDKDLKGIAEASYKIADIMVEAGKFNFTNP